jgi:ankyrin repeat protein
MKRPRKQPVADEPPAYTEGFLHQDYERVIASIQEDPTQATLSFSPLRTTLLHAACYDGRADIAEMLIGMGADVHAQEVNGRTPLHDAANNGHLGVVDVLIRHGANLYAKDGQGMTPLMWGEISRSGFSRDVVAKLKSYGA